MADYTKMTDEEIKESKAVVQKWIILDAVESSACVLKFHLARMELTVGGYAAHFEFIKYIISDFVVGSGLVEMGFSEENKHSQRNKLKYVFNMRKADVEKVVEELQKSAGINCFRISRHGRIC